MRRSIDGLMAIIRDTYQMDPYANALYLFYIQLAVNIIWPFIFFGLCQYLVAFLWIILLWLLVLDTTVTFGSIDRRAGFLLIPYMLWISFAAYLNLAVFFLN